MSVTLSQIKGIAISTFIFGFTTLLFLFISLQGVFWSLVSRPLGRLTTLFKGIADGTEPLKQDLSIATRDEIGELKESFNQMARHLYNAQEDLKKNAENLRSIFEGISDPLALVNPDCTLEITNKTYRDWIAQGKSAVFTKKCKPEDCDADTMCPVCYLRKVKKEWITIGATTKGTVIIIGHLYYLTEDGEDRIRIITARKATKKEREQYEKIKG
ncbi:MAG: HAMP domain-containing protein [Thermodesulfovibrionales bacterium]|nr:HAMP domain-containing protein [Thermodesulfovibrionales bacterium]